MTTVIEPLTYEDGNGFSFFSDLLLRHESKDAQARLYRHSLDNNGKPFELPWYLQDLWLDLREAKGLLGEIHWADLPPSTDAVSIPKILTGRTVGTVHETDLTHTSICAPVKTIAGIQDVAWSAIRGGGVPDRVLFRDLVDDYLANLSTQIYLGAGTGNQFRGIGRADAHKFLVPRGRGATALAHRLIAGIVAVEEGRFLSPDLIIIHPDRRDELGAFLKRSRLDDIPVVDDEHAPEHELYVLRASDLILFHSDLHARSLTHEQEELRDVPSAQVFAYAAFTAERYPKGIACISVYK